MAGRSDLESLLSGVSEALLRIVKFDYVSMTLHDVKRSRMQGRFLTTPEAPVEKLSLPVDQDPAGWAWLNQQPLVIRFVDDETRWPEFRTHARAMNISALTVVPLTAGDNRLGALWEGVLRQSESASDVGICSNKHFRRTISPMNRALRCWPRDCRDLMETFHRYGAVKSRR